MYVQNDFLCRIRQFQFSLFNFFKVFPFTWDPNTKQFITNNKLQNRFRRESLLIPLSIIFQTYQMVKYLRVNEYGSIIFLCMFWIFNLIASVITWILYWNLDNYLAFLNGAVNFGEGIAGKQLF